MRKHTKRFKIKHFKRLIVTIVRNQSNNLNFGQQKLKRIQISNDDSNQSYHSPRTRRNENVCIPSPLKSTTATTSCVNRYKTKTKCKFTNFKLLGTPNDTTNIEDRKKLQNKGSKGLATTTQLYIAKIRFSQLAKNRTTR